MQRSEKTEFGKRFKRMFSSNIDISVYLHQAKQTNTDQMKQILTSFIVFILFPFFFIAGANRCGRSSQERI